MKVDKTQFYSGNKRHLKETMSQKSLPLSSYPMTQINNRYLERPLKNNSKNLSFKGLSFMGDDKKKRKQVNPTLVLIGSLAAIGLGLRFAPAYKEVGKFSIREFKEFTGKHIGNIGSDLFDHLKDSPLAKKMLKVNGDEAILYKKTVPQLIWDGLKYPFTILPADILNGTVELLSKIKPFKGWADNVLQKQFFKNIRQRSKIDAKMNSLQGLVKIKNDFQKVLENGQRKYTDSQISSEMFQRSVKMFDTEKYGAYDTKHERALNRLVSGLPPAIFLANDAYNLSRMMDDDAKKAEKEKKTRFSQETARILSSGYLTLITLGALNKYINNSKFGIMLSTGLTVLFTEALSRLINGKHIKKLTPEQARLENEKNNAPEKNIKPDTSFKANPAAKTEKAPQQKPLLSFDTLLKGSAIIIAAGVGIKSLRKIPSVDNMFKAFQEPFQKWYNKKTINPDYKITGKEFKKIVAVLDKNGFKDLAKKYTNIAEKLLNEETDFVNGMIKDDAIIHLGAKEKKAQKIIITFLKAPFKFAYNTITLPYRLFNKAVQMFKPKSKQVTKTAEQLAEELFKKDKEALATTIQNIGKKAMQKGITPKEFQTFVKDNILKSFNVTTMSNVSNAELSNLAKTASAAATIWFLMTDNYNMVMLKSNGNDKEGAETKFKERFVQEGSRLFYQTLLIDLFNSTFRNAYHASLAGMSAVTLVDTTLGEILTRKSVGMPVRQHSRAELEAIEEKQNNATGFLKGYYNFMRRLTGKRSIESYHVNSKGTSVSAKSEQPVNFTNSSPVFDKIIKA